MEQHLVALGLDTSVQDFTYMHNQNEYHGSNLQGILRAPRAEGTEALVLSAPWKTSSGKDNYYGIKLLLSLAKHFKS